MATARQEGPAAGGGAEAGPSPCSVCGGAVMRQCFGVAPFGGEHLVPTADQYGSALSDVVECVACGHKQVAVIPTPDDLGVLYEEAADDAHLEEEEGQRATAARTLELIERHVECGRILDIGCWVGILLDEARRRGWDPVGLEPSRWAADAARERFGIPVETAPLGGAELPAASFDAVVMGDVIEHLPDPGEAVAEIARLLVPGGALYLALPDAGSTLARRMGPRWWSVLPGHVQYFTRKSVAELLVRHGYTVEWIGTAPKAFSARYYLGRLGGYSERLARAAIAVAGAARLDDRLVAPDFRDRMGVVARLRDTPRDEG